MRAGRLRHRVAIQSKSTSRDTFGEESASWSTDVTVWAGVEHVTGTEKEHAGKYIATATHKFWMRGVTALSPDQRILWGSRVFGIVRVDDVYERGITLVVHAKEAVV